MLIVGIDPGKTTGMCYFRDGIYLSGYEALSLGDVWGDLLMWSPDIVIIESFYGGMMRNSKDPIEVIGVGRLYGERYDKKVIMQSPAVQVVHRDKVKSMHKSKHVRSAITHVLYYLGRQHGNH